MDQLRSGGARRSCSANKVEVSLPTPTSEPDPLWGRPCVAYNLHAELGDECAHGLAEVQEGLHGTYTGVLTCPRRSLHVSVASLLSPRSSYGQPKEAIWSRWGSTWSAGLRELAADVEPFEICFEALLVSEAAVVAVARPASEIERFRELAGELLWSAGMSSPQPSIVHCTLLRYATRGLRLDGLARSAAQVKVDARTFVNRVVVSKELVYPNLVDQVIDYLPLGRAQSWHRELGPGRAKPPG